MWSFSHYSFKNCLKLQKPFNKNKLFGNVEAGGKGTGTFPLLIYMRTFFVLSKMGSVSHVQVPLDLNLSCPVCKKPRYDLHRQKESLGIRNGSPVPVHGFWARLTAPRKAGRGWWWGQRSLDNLHTHS